MDSGAPVKPWNWAIFSASEDILGRESLFFGCQGMSTCVITTQSLLKQHS
jgi:hypothetical protein